MFKDYHNLIVKALNRQLSFLIVNILLTLSSYTYCQSSLLINNFEKKDYRAGNQNWSICLGMQNHILFGNNNGLLCFDGASWKIKPHPNNTTIRSVLTAKNRIYAGSFEDFGYYEILNNSIGNYVSLAKPFRSSIHNEEFWRIVSIKDIIFFQSFGTIFYLSKDRIGKIPLDFSVLLLMQAGENIFTQAINGPIYRVDTLGLKQIKGSEIFKNTEVKSVVVLNSDTLFLTSTMGIFRFDGNAFTPWKTSIDIQLIKSNPNIAQSQGSKLAIGTILEGVFIFDNKGKLLHHIDSKLIHNNTILSMQFDSIGNLWLGKDKGISYVAFNSPISTYVNEKESFACYSGALSQNKLFLATNQGVYTYSLNPRGEFENQGVIDGTQGQCWFTKQIGNKLYFGLNNGTYSYSNGNLNKVCYISGGYNLERFGIEPSLFIQSTYRNLVTYSYENGSLRVNKIIPTYSSPTRFLQIDFQNYLWLGHTVTGIYRAQISNDLSEIVKIDTIGIKNNLNINTNRIYKIENRIVVPTQKNILRWDDISEQFIPFNEINYQLQGFEKCKAIISLPANHYWFIKDDEWGLFEIRYGEAKLKYRILPQAYNIEMVDGYENIVSLNDSLQIICLDNGFSILNLKMFDRIPIDIHPPIITEVVIWNGEQNVKSHPRLNRNNELTIPWRKNNVSFSFTSKDIIGVKHFYQYMLDGVDREWSEWTPNTSIDYKRLSPGTYRFKVRTLDSKGHITPNATVTIKVLPPLYASWKAIGFYILLGFAITAYTRARYKKKVKKHYEEKRKLELEKINKEKEEKEKIIIKLQNEKLQADIENKNSQLALSTMAIVRKNQLLQDIAQELEGLKNELGYRIPNKYYSKISRLITQDIESDHDWEIFEKLFDQAHQNFFRRLKENYPSLTPSDLRLCAYLRMNLSSKEIAPLLNISIRGVEERRYRLRKRLGLDTNDNLNDFILKF
ncbi:MAG TPA: triple tyrosine motif-containing protein [Tenuifilum sp.]|uniref:triple tyrosine motif-containing protein n=1 Tax=Tenuifilum sp. TaxID=2760880 RepID=UPI002C62AB05|nr:triple tyrosine motif-containing protein [Tenuifilum sp.]HOK84964.1 triple tyrosine motif-containing protein [Tenuifilum sp.]HQG71287.1 triple tyrosine motif-containing protein [Tenuifilum sp.]HRU85162.1 triple tyrosine motif-containing protein [Tenuifilum sp.]